MSELRNGIPQFAGDISQPLMDEMIEDPAENLEPDVIPCTRSADRPSGTWAQAGGSLVDRLIDEQDEVMRQLDELDARIERVITGLIQSRDPSEKSAA